jgi:hypothetical protein
MALRTEIQDSDYNDIRNKIIAVMGEGGIDPLTNEPDATFGYGQSIVSSQVNAGTNITAAQWDALRFDLLNARIHQDGTTPGIIRAIKGQTIKFSQADPNNSYDSQSNVAINNRFDLGAGQFVIDSKTTRTRTTAWKNSVSTEVRVTFTTVDYARWFFNSGSKIRFTSTRSGGSLTAQNNSWSNLLNTVGAVEFGAVTAPLGYYTLTNIDQIFKTETSTSPYDSNNYTITVKSNVANNSNGGATQLTFTITWTDGYIDPGNTPPSFPVQDNPNTVDNVDGTLSLIVEEKRASGVLQPSGTGAFIIVGPSYSSDPITGS